MIDIKKDTLKAALISTPKKDIRYYLNGVLFRVGASGQPYIASTDGHRLFVAKIDATWTDEPQSGPFEMIIPRETVELAIKSKLSLVTLSALPDGRYSLGDISFLPIDGKFPEINSVIPQSAPSGEIAHFNPDYLADAQKALNLIEPSEYGFMLQHNGHLSAGFMACASAFVAIMPMRSDSTVSGSTFLAD